MEGEPTAQEAAVPDAPEQDLAALEAHAVDFQEFESWVPIVNVAVIGALVVALFLQVVLGALGAPDWAFDFIAVLYVCTPLIFFTRWVWNKPALRLPDGTVLPRGEARLLTLKLCVIYAAAIVQTMCRIPVGTALGAARRIRQRLFSDR
jgi:hypothetical protein